MRYETFALDSKFRPEPANLDKTLTILRAHTHLPQNHLGLYVVHTPLKVYKAVHSADGDKCLANIIIPVGARIIFDKRTAPFADDYLKMRADVAICESIWEPTCKPGRTLYENLFSTKNRFMMRLSVAQSLRSPKFKYRPAPRKIVDAALAGQPIVSLQLLPENSVHPSRSIADLSPSNKHLIVPTNGFAMSSTTCAAGIHFFVQLICALKY